MESDFFKKLKSKDFWRLLIPPPRWQAPVAIVLGLFVGLALTAFKISNAASYLSDDPKTCINCHLMIPQYATWQHGSHGRNTTCNDCHVPHDNVFRKYFFKAMDGSRHATIFTLRTEPQVIRIGEPGKTVVQENCIRCHGKLTSEVSAITVTNSSHKKGAGSLCWDCHRETPHGHGSGQASTPNAIVPNQAPPAPDWLMNLTNKK